MLTDKIILYDDSCPMCSLYTEAFVRLRLLLPSHRIGFASASEEHLKHLDRNRARHEIPLVDSETGEVIYGIDALFLIISHRFPVLRHLFRLRLFRAPVYGLYQIVTYNRRVIAGTASSGCGFDCAPDFNLKYRLLYLVLALSVWATLLYGFFRTEIAAHDPALHAAFLAACGLQALAFVRVYRRRDRWDYISNTATNALIFGLLLLPALLAFSWPAASGAILVTACVIAALDYARRIRNLARLSAPCATLRPV